MDKLYTLDDGVFAFDGAISVERQGDTATPWRLPYEQRFLFPEIGWADASGGTCSGVRIAFTTDAAAVTLLLEDAPEDMMLDLVVNGKLIASTKGAQRPGAYPFSLPAGREKKVEVWLDTKRRVFLRGLLLDEGAAIRKTRVRKPRWVHYGSSISQANAAQSPSCIWPALAAREAKLHLISLGYSGRCILNPMVGRMIRDMQADLITLKIGINVHAGKLGEMSFSANAISLIELIREKHPRTPLAVVSPIYSPPRETQKFPPAGLSLTQMREELAFIVRHYQESGDRRIRYMDGLELIGPQDLPYLPDELHPNAEAQFVIARRIAPMLRDMAAQRVRR